ncbi:uncharacterized protein QYS62_008273 [Fusarium acuminatum]|jgi:CHAT domain-containing protein|uniref:CHAT domain-containing protein n=1 Tax=Fusarium acuminatum TaxID=5515 RepID=A0ABZ2X240_9HYPO
MSTVGVIDVDESAFLRQYAALVQAALQGDQNEAVTEGLKAILARTSRLELSCKCAMTLSTIYTDQRDLDAAVLWARTALDQAESIGNIDMAWVAAKCVTIAWRDRLVFTNNLGLGEFEDFHAFVTSWVEKAGEGRQVDDQIEMLGIISQVEGVKSQLIDCVEKKASAKQSLAWLAKATDLLELLPEGGGRLAALADIQFRSADAYCRADEFATAVSCMELAQSLFTQENMKRQATKAQTKKAQIYQLWIYEACIDIERVLPPAEVESILNTILQDLESVEKNLIESGMRFQLVKCRYQKALIWEHAHRLGMTEALQYALEELVVAEDMLNRIRSDMTLQKDEEILRHKASLVARGTNIHELGIRLSLAARQTSDAWEWVQRGKARAFLDLLSFEESVPTSFLDTAWVSKRARELLDEEAELMQECETAPLQNRFSIRQKLAACRDKMSDIEELVDVRLFRGMASLTKGRLKDMFSSREYVVCVDWVVVESVIFMFTIRPGGEPAVTKLALSVEEVLLWIQSNLKAEYLRQPRANEKLRELNPLASPLSTESRPGDLLVFCPAGLLSGLPLHALQIDNQLLIERNTVVYAPSLAVLHLCLFRRSEDAAYLKRSAVFGNPSCDRSKAEDSSKKLAQKLGVTPYIGKEATKESFLLATQNTDLALYHGHAAFNPSDPLQSALILNQGDNTEPSSRYLTAREILQVRLKVVLFVMIACESAKQEFKAGEEPTGLLPMLMLAGANSVIGTLWKCSDIAGGEFAEELFAALLHSTAAAGSASDRALFEIARAVQKAALAIRKNRPAPYFWAPFVLCGSWECWVTNHNVQAPGTFNK